jgi:hypothetical protein
MEKKDGRSERATGRTEQLATRVTAEFGQRVRDIAKRDGIKLVVLWERAIEAYEKEKRRSVKAD